MRELSAQDLATVNDFLAGQLRAGLPLEPGLKSAAADWPGHAGSVLRDLIARLERGEPLDRALTDAAGRVPVAYAALIRAGMSSGKLPEVLDELTKLAEMRTNARRTLTLSLVYPAIVVLLAILLGFFMTTRMVPAIARDLADSGEPVPGSMALAAGFGEAVARSISPAGIVAIVVIAAITLLALVANVGARAERRMEYFPLLGRAWKDARIAYWAWLTAIMMERGMPEPETVELASESSGFSGNRESVRAVADILRAGKRPTAADWHATGAPALAVWALNATGPLENRSALLRMVSMAYERKSQARLILASRLLPLIFLVFVGGAFVLTYGLALFFPLARLYEGLA